MSRQHTLAEIATAVVAVADHGSQAAAARALGLSRTTLQSRADQARYRAPNMTLADWRAVLAADGGKPPYEMPATTSSASAVPEAATAPRYVRLQDENTRLRAEIKATHRDNLDAETVRESIFGLAANAANPPAWLTPAATGRKAKLRASVPSTIWSDWHLGENVTKAEVNGVNAFNLEIAAERIERLVERTIDLCFHHMTQPDYPGIVVNILGDIVSGDIHTELSETNDAELFQVILWARDHIIAALKRMADAFGRVFCPCVPGNHGRTTRKPQAKRYIYKNADWLIYCLVERHFLETGDSRVQFQIPATGEALYRVFNHRYMGVHGDDLGVKGGDGIIGAIGPIMRGEIKVNGSSSQIGRGYDTLMMGHWHQTLWLPRAIVNNTLKGYDEYARRMLRAPATPPAQNLWFTHQTRGITARWEVRLDDSPAVADAPWLTWENAPSEGRAAA